MSKQAIRPQGAEGISHARTIANPSPIVNGIGNEHLIFGNAVHAAAAVRGMASVLNAAECCATAMAGIETLAGVLRWSSSNHDLEDGLPSLNEYQTDSLVGLIQVTANLLLEHVQRAADHTRTSFGQGEQA